MEQKLTELQIIEEKAMLGAKLRADARKYDLDAPGSFWLASDYDIGNAYNGTGPDWMPDWTREALDEFYDIYQPAVAIHDWRFACSDKTKSGFVKANKEFLENMRKIRAVRYPWHRVDLYPECARYYIRARLAYRACQIGGWSAWLD